ncbi:MAG: putative Ig domain-containing protein, partial [Candidatus Omnitrophota bacterium]
MLATIGNKTGSENTLLSFTVTASDPDGGTLTLSASNLPSGAVFNASTGVFSWTPSYSQAGTYANVSFQVTDGTDSDSENISITITDTNRAPVLNQIGAKSTKEQTALSFTVLATDADSDTLTYSAASLPSGASYSNRNFTWTPNIGQAGTYNVTFSVSDGKGGIDSEIVAITVSPVDLVAPYAADLTPSAGEVQVDRNTSVIINVKDDGDGVDKDTINVSIHRKGDTAPKQIVRDGVSLLAAQYPNAVVIQGTPVDYLVKYDPPLKKDYRFSYEQDITVSVSAEDLNNNALDNHSYSFTTSMILRGSNKKISTVTDTATASLLTDAFIKTAIADDGDAATEVVSSITLDKHDAKNVYAAWHDESLGSIWTAKSIDRGQTFATKTKVSSLTTGLNQNPVITTDFYGNTYVIWQNQQTAGDWNLYFARRLAGTSTFEVGEIPVDNILGADTEQTEPSIDADADGKVSIAWVNQGNGNDGIYFAQSTDKGVSFWTIGASAVKKANDGTATTVASPCVKVDSTGDNKYLVWSGVKNDKRKIFFNRFNVSNTKAYASDLQVSDDATSDNAAHPVIAVPPVVGTDDANMCVAWKNQQGTDTDIFLDSSETGAVWGTDIQVNDDAQVPQTQKEPVIGVDDDYKVYCAWSDYRNGDWDIYLAMSNDKGASFGTNILINDDGGTAVQLRPAMNLSADGKHMCLTWTDYRNAAAYVYFNRNSFFDEDLAEASVVDNAVGGTVQATTDADISGVEVVVPAQFMDAPATVTITKVENAPPMDGDQHVSKTIDFGPSGIVFNKPALIRIPYTAADLSAAGVSDARRLRIFFYNLKTLMWEKLTVSQVDTTNGLVSAEVGHFSLYGLGDGGAIVESV